MFNIGGGEFLVIGLIALVVLGPSRLPDAARQVGKVMADLRKISTGFQNEIRDAFDDTDRPSPSPLAPTAMLPGADTMGGLVGTGPTGLAGAIEAVSAQSAPPGDGSAPAKKAPARKRAGTKKQAATKKSATTKKAAAKNAPVKKAAAKKTAAKKAAAPRAARRRSSS